ncbi:MAG TPA: sodium:proton antiporter [Myxococcota bacterium]|nr:sodium:proton antiporter [Myxococcota bacterium]
MDTVANSFAKASIVEPMVVLLVVATLVGIISHRVKLPYTVLLMLVGIGLSSIGLVPNIDLTQELLLGVFLPALLFEAAIHFPLKELRLYAPTIAMLAAPGVILTALATALVLLIEISTFRVNAGMTFMHYLLFGTIIAATDPIAIIALFKQLGVKRKLAIILEGESLFNDGTAIVIYSVVLAALTSGVFSFKDGAYLFVTEALFGIATGAVFGALANLTLPFAKDPLISIAITTVAAYGSFIVAESLHASGVLATATAGLLLGNIGKRYGLEPASRMAVVGFWRYMSFFVSTLVFLLIGLKVNLLFLVDHATLIVFAFLAVLASRAISVFLPLGLLNRMGQPMTIKSATAIWWGGLRGSLSMVLVLSIPDTIAGKDTLIAMTFGVVVLSVLLQGCTMGPLVKILGLVETRSEAMTFMARCIARLRAISAQQKVYASMAIEEGVHDDSNIAARLHEERQTILAELKKREMDEDFIKAKKERIHYVEQLLSEVEEDSLRKSAESHLITEDDLNDLIKVTPS